MKLGTVYSKKHTLFITVIWAKCRVHQNGQFHKNVTISFLTDYISFAVNKYIQRNQRKMAIVIRNTINFK